MRGLDGLHVSVYSLSQAVHMNPCLTAIHIRPCAALASSPPCSRCCHLDNSPHLTQVPSCCGGEDAAGTALPMSEAATADNSLLICWAQAGRGGRDPQPVTMSMPLLTSSTNTSEGDTQGADNLTLPALPTGRRHRGEESTQHPPSLLHSAVPSTTLCPL